MDKSLSYFPSIISTSPANGQAGVTNLPEIAARFTMDLKTVHDYLDIGDMDGLNAKLNELITLFPKSNPVPVKVVFESYDQKNYILYIVPITPLTQGETYSIIFSRDFRAVNGRAMAADETWHFTVNSSSVARPSLTAPLDNTVYHNIPEFSWEAADGAETYAFAISRALTFNRDDIVYEAETSSTSLSNIVSTLLTDKSTYYWRVTGIADTVSGPSSDIRSFRLDSSPDPHPDSKVRPVFGELKVSSTYPEDASEIIEDKVTPLIVFSRDIDQSSVSDKFSIKSAHVDGVIAGAAATYSPSISVTGSVVELQELSVSPNTIYTVTVAPGIRSTDGKVLQAKHSFSFHGMLVPIYSTAATLRSVYGRFLSRYSDYEIEYQIHRSSIRCNRKVYKDTDIPVSELLTQEAQVTYEMQVFSELHAAYCLIQQYQWELLEEVDRKTQLDTYAASTGSQLLKDIAEILKKIEEELEEAEDELGDVPTPKVGVRSSAWDPSTVYDDLSIGYVQRKKF